MTEFFRAIGNMFESGITWVAILAAFSALEKYLDKRRTNKLLLLIALKVGVEWDTPQEEFKKLAALSFKKLYSLSHKDIIRRRMNMDKLKSRKLWLAIFGALFPVLNVELGINLDPNVVFGVLTVIVSGIAGLAHVDGKRAQAVVKALKTSVVVDPNATYNDLKPLIQKVHDGINDLQKQAKTNDVNVLAAYQPILDLIESFKHPEPVSAVEDKVAS